MQIWFIYRIWILNFLARKIHDKSLQFLRCISSNFCDKKFHRMEIWFRNSKKITCPRIKSEYRNSIRIFRFRNYISTPIPTFFNHCTFVQLNSTCWMLHKYTNIKKIVPAPEFHGPFKSTWNNQFVKEKREFTRVYANKLLFTWLNVHNQVLLIRIGVSCFYNGFWCWL